jgi:hypothetical protein
MDFQFQELAGNHHLPGAEIFSPSSGTETLSTVYKIRITSFSAEHKAKAWGNLHMYLIS